MVVDLVPLIIRLVIDLTFVGHGLHNIVFVANVPARPRFFFFVALSTITPRTYQLWPVQSLSGNYSSFRLFRKLMVQRMPLG